MDLGRSLKGYTFTVKYPNNVPSRHMSIGYKNALKKALIVISTTLFCWWGVWFSIMAPQRYSQRTTSPSLNPTMKLVPVEPPIIPTAQGATMEPFQVPTISKVLEKNIDTMLPYYKPSEFIEMNTTLGFGKIFYINLPTRYDNEDTLQLQATLTDLEMQLEPAVFAQNIKFKGLPPSSNLKYQHVKKGELACFRSHANVWRRVLKEKLDTALILEADAAWDMNIKKIMSHYGQALAEMLRKYEFIPEPLKPTENDPYLSQHWDVLHFGGCFENRKYINASMPYYDPYTGGKGTYLSIQELKPETRMIRFQPEQMCTTGYAVSRSGAMKLLARGAMNLDGPVDGLIAELIRKNKIRAFGAYPNPFVQWIYKNNIGADFYSSNMGAEEKMINLESINKESFKNAWKEAKKDMSVWDYNGLFNEQRFKEPALFNLKKHIYKESSDL